jgi:GNAT superfamily N-acetyltransferase
VHRGFFIGSEMSRRIVPLTLDRLAELSAPCRTCLFWELDPVRRSRVPPQEAAETKEAWLSEVLREWGSCGRVAVVDDRAVGFIVYVPASYAPGSDSFPTAPVSPDAVLLTTAWVDPEYAGGGLGRMLVQGMARDLLRRGGIKAVEAFGDVGPASALAVGDSPGKRCAAPAEFLARVGFKTHRAHPTAPRLRMELTSAVTWRDEVEAALERLLGAVRPHHQPQPHPTHRDVNP